MDQLFVSEILFVFPKLVICDVKVVGKTQTFNTSLSTNLDIKKL